MACGLRASLTLNGRFWQCVQPSREIASENRDATAQLDSAKTPRCNLFIDRRSAETARLHHFRNCQGKFFDGHLSTFHQFPDRPGYVDIGKFCRIINALEKRYLRRAQAEILARRYIVEIIQQSV